MDFTLISKPYNSTINQKNNLRRDLDYFFNMDVSERKSKLSNRNFISYADYKRYEKLKKIEEEEFENKNSIKKLIQSSLEDLKINKDVSEKEGLFTKILETDKSRYMKDTGVQKPMLFSNIKSVTSKKISKSQQKKKPKAKYYFSKLESPITENYLATNLNLYLYNLDKSNGSSNINDENEINNKGHSKQYYDDISTLLIDNQKNRVKINFPEEEEYTEWKLNDKKWTVKNCLFDNSEKKIISNVHNKYSSQALSNNKGNHEKLPTISNSGQPIIRHKNENSNFSKLSNKEHISIIKSNKNSDSNNQNNKTNLISLNNLTKDLKNVYSTSLHNIKIEEINNNFVFTINKMKSKNESNNKEYKNENNQSRYKNGQDKLNKILYDDLKEFIDRPDKSFNIFEKKSKMETFSERYQKAVERTIRKQFYNLDSIIKNIEGELSSASNKIEEKYLEIMNSKTNKYKFEMNPRSIPLGENFSPDIPYKLTKSPQLNLKKENIVENELDISGELYQKEDIQRFL